MQELIGHLIRICRKSLIIFALATALLFGSEIELWGNKTPAAIAKSLTPEAEFSETAKPDRSPTADAEKSDKEAADSIREKLNRDRPAAPSIERLIESAKNNPEEIVTPARKAVEKAANRDK